MSFSRPADVKAAPAGPCSWMKRIVAGMGGSGDWRLGQLCREAASGALEVTDAEVSGSQGGQGGAHGLYSLLPLGLRFKWDLISRDTSYFRRTSECNMQMMQKANWRQRFLWNTRVAREPIHWNANHFTDSMTQLHDSAGRFIGPGAEKWHLLLQLNRGRVAYRTVFYSFGKDQT